MLVVVAGLFFVADAAAQDKHGDVVIHTDPRLGLLVKKEKMIARASIEKERAVTKAALAAKELAIAEKAAVAAGTTIAGDKSVAVKIGPPAPGNMTPVKTGTPVAVTSAPVKIGPPVAGPNVPVARAEAPLTVAEVEKPAPPRMSYPKLISPPDGRVIYSGKGFRVQIYNGPDRGKAMDIKKEFMREHPAVRTYFSYMSPCFRVKVGDFRNRSDAAGMLREVRETYVPSMIVPDVITVNTY